MKYLLLALALLGCGKKTELPEPPIPSEQLSAKWEWYARNLPDDAFDNDCDGLLFKSLSFAGTPKEFPIERWRDSTGQWYRQSNHSNCKPTSRDMILGAMWYWWAHKRRDLAEETFQYGLDRWFIMDLRSPKISYLLEPMQYTLALLVHELGGKDYGVWRIPASCVGFLTGFEGHLQALQIGLRAAMGHGDDKSKDCIQHMVDAQPRNAFYQAVLGRYTGNQDAATALLLDETLWPEGRLPNCHDRNDGWITQREDAPKDWGPGPAECTETWSGGDFLVAAALVLGKI